MGAAGAASAIAVDLIITRSSFPCRSLSVAPGASPRNSAENRRNRRFTRKKFRGENDRRRRAIAGRHSVGGWSTYRGSAPCGERDLSLSVILCALQHAMLLRRHGITW